MLQLHRVSDLGRRYELGGADAHGVQLAIQRAFPESQKLVQHRKLRCDVQILPDETLQQPRVVGQMIQDFGGGEAIAVQLQCQAHSMSPSLGEKPPEMPSYVLPVLRPASDERVRNHGALVMMWAIEKCNINRALALFVSECCQPLDTDP